MDRLTDQVLIVTGGAHGIGRAYCEGLAKEGARVVVADIDGPGAEAVAHALGENGHDALAVAIDVSREEDTEHMAAEAVATRRCFRGPACPVALLSKSQWTSGTG